MEEATDWTAMNGGGGGEMSSQGEKRREDWLAVLRNFASFFRRIISGEESLSLSDGRGRLVVVYGK